MNFNPDQPRDEDGRWSKIGINKPPLMPGPRGFYQKFNEFGLPKETVILGAGATAMYMTKAILKKVF